MQSAWRWHGDSGAHGSADRTTRELGIRLKYRWSPRGVVMVGALLLGLFCGIVARILVPGDAFRNMSGPLSWLISLVLGLAGRGRLPHLHRRLRPRRHQHLRLGRRAECPDRYGHRLADRDAGTSAYLKPPGLISGANATTCPEALVRRGQLIVLTHLLATRLHQCGHGWTETVSAGADADPWTTVDGANPLLLEIRRPYVPRPNRTSAHARATE